MRALVVEAHGGPDMLCIRRWELPAVAPDDVQIDVHAIGVNYPDLLVINGTYQNLPQLPFVPGKEATGVVSAVGADIKNFAIGDRVLASIEHGAYAERIHVPASLCHGLPAGVSMVAGATLGIAYQTAYFALLDRARFQVPETIFVTGAAGGVGIATVQLAKALGARVIAGVSTGEKAAFVQAHGADATVLVTGPNLRDSIRHDVAKLTGGNGADIVIDTVGGDVFDGSIRALAWCGRIVVIGFTSGRPATLRSNYLLIKNITATGLHWSDYRDRRPDAVHGAMRHLLDLLSSGKIDPPVSTYPFERAADALSEIAERRVLGKIVLTTAANHERV